MKIYLRKIDAQCINKQISYPKDILSDFLDGKSNHDTILCEGKNSHVTENVTLLLATDPRFDNKIKTILKAEGNLEFGDIMVMYKHTTKYIVELVKPTDKLHSSFTSLFIENDRHLLSNISDEISFSTVCADFDDVERVKGGENIILYGVPGAGKSWTIKKEYCDVDSKIERLVFHPDYTYSDFVGQILPKLDENKQVTYVFTPGPFTNILKKAYKNPTDKYYLIIEEVNRGNAPAIFGDIFQLLDRNVESGESEYSITNADIAREVYGDENHKVFIPSNLSILGTMNTSDQNVFTLDTAFQRRWSMRLIQNKFPEDGSEDDFAKTPILDTEVTWEKFFTEINSIILNKSIRMTSSEDKRLGTHFVTKDDLIIDKSKDSNGKLTNSAVRHNRKFAEKVLKYLWDDAFKFNKDEIFDLTKVNSLEKVIVKFTSVEGNKRFEEILKQNIYDTLVPKKTN